MSILIKPINDVLWLSTLSKCLSSLKYIFESVLHCVLVKAISIITEYLLFFNVFFTILVNKDDHKCFQQAAVSNHPKWPPVFQKVAQK